ncbi:MAG: hypothetical protein HRT67_07060 [Flavobacteriaceae bacterium]|nr:hypothetical protein [Flavobacteriaceae bacterium]
MKLLYAFFTVISILFTNNVFAQRIAQHPIFDRLEVTSACDTIPDFNARTEKIKVYGTVYEQDGITPAKDVILYIEQPDVDGDFKLKHDGDKKYVHHRAWVKTDENGHYSFYTFVPGNDRRYNQMQQIFPSVKQPSRPVYDLASFLFEEDPLLSRRCRKRMNKNGDPTRILKFKKEGDILAARKNIVLVDTNDKLAKK